MVLRQCMAFSRIMLLVLSIILLLIASSSSEHEDANSKLKRCCKAYEPMLENRTAIDECLNRFCDFDLFKQSTVLVFLKHCSGDVVGNMFSCASSNADHTKCCQAKGVSERCLVYCSTHKGAPPNYMQYLDCIDHFDDIHGCFKDFLEKNSPAMPKTHRIR